MKSIQNFGCKTSLENLAGCRRITMRWILEGWDGRMESGWNWFRIVYSGMLCYHQGWIFCNSVCFFLLFIFLCLLLLLLFPYLFIFLIFCLHIRLSLFGVMNIKHHFLLCPVPESAGLTHEAAPSTAWSLSWESTSNSWAVPHTSSANGCIPGWRLSWRETACQHPLRLAEPSNWASYQQDHLPVLHQLPPVITTLLHTSLVKW